MKLFSCPCPQFAIVAVVALFMCAPSNARQEVQNNAFQQWTEKDVTKLLNDSAWARTQAIRVTRRKQVRSVAGQVGVEALGTTPTAADSKASLGGAEDAVDYRFTMRLRSALPIRQAIVRLVQLQSNYDEMQPAQKKSLDAQMRQLLECEECKDNYIVSVGFGSTNSHGVDLIYDWFRGQTLESLKGYIYLANDRGGRRELGGFIPPKVPGDEAFFFFARNEKEGKPLVTVNDKRVLFRMSDKNASSVTNFSLDVSKLVINGKVEF